MYMYMHGSTLILCKAKHQDPYLVLPISRHIDTSLNIDTTSPRPLHLPRVDEVADLQSRRQRGHNLFGKRHYVVMEITTICVQRHHLLYSRRHHIRVTVTHCKYNCDVIIEHILFIFFLF